VKIDKDLILVKGEKGELTQKLIPEIKIEIKDKEVILKEPQKTKTSSALWGTFRALIANMIEGVSKGFEKKLIIEGIGYRVALNGNKLVLSVGFSHPVEIQAPKGIEFKIRKRSYQAKSRQESGFNGHLKLCKKQNSKKELLGINGLRLEPWVMRNARDFAFSGAISIFMPS